MGLKAIVFDKDGVLSNSEKLKAQAWQQTLELWGVGDGFEWYLLNLGPTSLALAKLATETFGIDELPVRVAAEWDRRYRAMEQGSEAIEENLAILETLSRRYTIAVASSMDKDSIEAELKRFGCRQYIQVCVSGEEVENNKPAPDIYLEAVARLGFEPGDCLAIEDSPTGVRSAKSAGLRCVGYKNPLYNLDLGEADLVSDDLGQVDFVALFVDKKSR